jgi:hypothetical protein
VHLSGKIVNKLLVMMMMMMMMMIVVNKHESLCMAEKHPPKPFVTIMT